MPLTISCQSGTPSLSTRSPFTPSMAVCTLEADPDNPCALIVHAVGDGSRDRRSVLLLRRLGATCFD